MAAQRKNPPGRPSDADRAGLADTPTGRQAEPADERAPDDIPLADEDQGDYRPGEAEPDDTWKAVRTRPRSEVTDRTGETGDGLDDTEEAVRRAAEELPPGRRRGRRG